MWPSFRSRFARKLNQRLLTRTLTPLLKLQAEAPIVLTTIPLVADLVGRLPVAGWVYYCVDDFGSWPGYDGITLAAMERELVPRMDATIAVSTTLQQNLKRLGGANPELLTHGVSLEQWSYQGTPPIELHGFEQPLILFWGLIDQRLDVEWLTVLSQRMTQGTILLLGPIDTFSPAIQQLPHVRRLPAMPVERLPEFAASAQVLIMPYRDIPATRAMQPLKLMEYLATDKPVVVRSLPSTVEWSDCCDVVENANLFAQRVLECFRGDLCNAQRLARDRLREHNWNSKSAWLSRFLDSVAVRTGTPHPTFMQSRKS
jgi:glycosyltransferase involved in cell wall biosynthesis